MTAEKLAAIRARKMANRLGAMPSAWLSKDQRKALRAPKPVMHKPARASAGITYQPTQITYQLTANTSGCTSYYWTSNGTGTATWVVDDTTWDAWPDAQGVVTVKRENPRRYDLPDGSSIHVDVNGNYRIEDKDAKTVYVANRNRDFNPFVNAADLLARFIDYLGTLDVRREEVATLPLQLFVNWLIVEAAQKDGDDVPADVRPVPQHPLLIGRIAPRCLVCDMPVNRDHAAKGFSFCSPDHAVEYSKRLAA